MSKKKAKSRNQKRSRGAGHSETRRPQDFSAEEKLSVLLEIEGLTEEELGAYLRRRGLYEAQVRQWRAVVTEALDKAIGRPKVSPEQRAHKKRIASLERELRRKDKALAETAALLVLKKKPWQFGGTGNRSLSPKQIVPRLADKGVYIASESTTYRILAQADQLKHREPSKPRRPRRPAEHVAHGPLEVWSWDITYLRSPIRGMFYYLYMVIDVWSRKIVGWRVEETENMDYASMFIRSICDELEIDPNGLVLHSDNGGPMKGSTMLATLQNLGIVPSFSRPRVSDDNPYSEALFRTLKYRPRYPQGPFQSIDQARTWVQHFVSWYNNVHLHSAINFVT